MRKNKSMTDEIRLCHLKDYLSSPLSQYQFEKEKGLSHHSISAWLRNFELEDKHSFQTDPFMNSDVQPKEQELLKRIHALEQQVKSLKVELKQSNMARDAYNCMIDLAESTYNIKVRKNSDAK